MSQRHWGASRPLNVAHEILNSAPELLPDVAFAAGNRPLFQGLMAGYALNMESILERRSAVFGFLQVAGIASLPLSAPVIQVCIKIMMAPGAVQLFRMKLVIELDQGSLVLSEFLVIEQEGIILGMNHRDESGNNEDNQ